MSNSQLDCQLLPSPTGVYILLIHVNIYRLSTSISLARMPRALSPRLLSQIRYSSGSPKAGSRSPDHFVKTGEKELDPAKVHSRSNEYSQSGGYEMVAGQETASFSRDTDLDLQKEMAGKGNAVNPLGFSPATPGLSKALYNKGHSSARCFG